MAYMKYQYKILPSGNANQFPEIEAEILKRGVRLEYVRTKAGGTFYRWPQEDNRLLPRDENGPYFGDDNSGWPLGDYSADLIEEDRQAWCGGDVWRKANPGHSK
jgi:hypothetical protein